MSDKAMTNELITEEWLRSVGFKWHQLERQLTKHWLLWLGDAVREKNSFTSYDDLGIVVTARSPTDTSQWYCWLRADYSGIMSRFIHVRHIHTQAELITLCEALTGQKWNPENNLYGSMRKPDHAKYLREESERLDRKIVRDMKWRDIEKDDSIGRPLPEHLEAYHKAHQEQSK